MRHTDRRVRFDNLQIGQIAGKRCRIGGHVVVQIGVCAVRAIIADARRVGKRRNTRRRRAVHAHGKLHRAARASVQRGNPVRAWRPCRAGWIAGATTPRPRRSEESCFRRNGFGDDDICGSDVAIVGVPQGVRDDTARCHRQAAITFGDRQFRRDSKWRCILRGVVVRVRFRTARAVVTQPHRIGNQVHAAGKRANYPDCELDGTVCADAERPDVAHTQRSRAIADIARPRAGRSCKSGVVRHGFGDQDICRGDVARRRVRIAHRVRDGGAGRGGCPTIIFRNRQIVRHVQRRGIGAGDGRGRFGAGDRHCVCDGRHTRGQGAVHRDGDHARAGRVCRESANIPRHAPARERAAIARRDERGVCRNRVADRHIRRADVAGVGEGDCVNDVATGSGGDATIAFADLQNWGTDNRRCVLRGIIARVRFRAARAIIADPDVVRDRRCAAGERAVDGERNDNRSGMEDGRTMLNYLSNAPLVEVLSGS